MVEKETEVQRLAKKYQEQRSTARPGGWREERSPDGRMTMYVSPKGERLSKSEVDEKYPGKFTTVDDMRDRMLSGRALSRLETPEQYSMLEDRSDPRGWWKEGNASLESKIHPADLHAMTLSRAKVRSEDPSLREMYDNPRDAVVAVNAAQETDKRVRNKWEGIKGDAREAGGKERTPYPYKK